MSIVSVLNIVIVGAVVYAFGEPRLLEGVKLGVQSLVQMGVPIGDLITVTVFAGLGLSVWRKA